MNIAVQDAGSFRDPAGQVFLIDEEIIRAITPRAVDRFLHVDATGFMKDLVRQQRLVDYRDISSAKQCAAVDGSAMLLSHPRIPFISYPYEWSFALLKSAALHHLDLQLDALEHGLKLVDATAYNVQFIGARPIFIDHLSFDTYVEDEIWQAHHQFCMQFLNPLIIWSKVGIAPNAWFRGSLEGISPEDTAKILPFGQRFSRIPLMHVFLQAAMQRRSLANAQASASKTAQTARLSRQGFRNILADLRAYIARLEPPNGRTVWRDYAANTSYAGDEARIKSAFVHRMISSVRAQTVIDLGCNSGDYSVVALDAGAQRVIGFDFDHGALEQAYARATAKNLDFLPLWLDAANPSPNQGWAQAERKGLSARANADTIIALAVLHHLVIGRNIPMDMAIHWIVSLAPQGIIEFPHKGDPMVQTLLAQRQDIFDSYCEDAFISSLERHACIVEREVVIEGSRTLFWYRRHPAA